MSTTVTPFLRNVLVADAAMSGAAGLLMLLAAPALCLLLDLPVGLLRWAGAALIPWSALLAVLARRPAMSRMMLIDVIAINALWVAGSLGILFSGAVSPNILGYGFVIAQAVAVGLLARLQFVSYRGHRAAA